eukprot:jgi/Ulvmu1/12899/UM098_0087.1
MVLSAEIIDVFLRVLQQLRNESNQRLEGLEEHAVDTVSNYLAGLSSSVKNEGGLLRAADEFGAEWKHAAGAPRKKEAKGRHLKGTAIPSVRLRLDGGSSILASWADSCAQPGIDRMVEDAMNNIESWENFNIFSVARLVQGHVLATVVFYSLERYGLIEKLGLPENKLLNFVAEIEGRYRPNPYHNAMHAADVTQSAMCMIACDGLSEGLTDLELLCIIISCCIHDVGHYGVNNDFLVKTQHEWALIYNDTSVNENMHVRVAFEVLQEPECNIFEDFSVEDYRFVRKTIKDIVLMTDMYHHSKLVQSLDSLVAAGPNETGVPLLKSLNANGRSVVLQMIVHAADISNTCRPPGPCGLWAKRVTDGEISWMTSPWPRSPSGA